MTTPHRNLSGRWQRPPFVAVRKTRHETWIRETREYDHSQEVRSEVEYLTQGSAERAAKVIATALAWPLVVLPAASGGP